MSSPALRRQLADGNASVIGVGQGAQTVREAAPQQRDLARAVMSLTGGPHAVFNAVDKDGERSVVIVPKLQSPGMAAYLGERYGQRSVLDGKEEIATGFSDKPRDSVLTEFDEARLTQEQPRGFWTYLPSEGLFYSLVQTRAHARKGRPVRGYATRRKVRA